MSREINEFRRLIRSEIRRIIREQEDALATKDDVAQDAPEQEEEPAEEPTEQEGLPQELADATNSYLKHVSRSEGSSDMDNQVEMLSMIVNRLARGSEAKLALLRAVKQATVR